MTFVGGDADRPMILGAAYNGKNPPPFPVPAKQTQALALLQGDCARVFRLARSELHLMAPRISMERREYWIAGSTAAQLRALMGLLGPSRGGRHFGAYTDWEVSWSYEHE